MSTQHFKNSGFGALFWAIIYYLMAGITVSNIAKNDILWPILEVNHQCAFDTNLLVM